MKKLHKKTFSIALVFIFIFNMLSVFNTNVYASDRVLDQVKSLIQNYYVFDVPQNVLDAENIDDTVKALNDPYSEYFSSEEYTDFINSINMKFLGIGVSIEIVPEGLKVVSVMKNQPAEISGIIEGDIITNVDGHSLEGLKFSEAVSYMRGDEGTSAKLVVKRRDKVLNFSITRKTIETQTVTSKVLEGNIGYMEIVSFGETTPSEFKQNLIYLKSKNVCGLIVDLRNNPGGHMNAAVDIAEYFIGQRVSLITENKSGNKEVYCRNDNGIELDMPVIFLINKYSASASEILSAAVKDYNRAFFIGETTYGKGVAQNLFSLFNGGVLKLTTMKFYSPKGNIIEKKGISPNLITNDKNSLLAAELLLGNSKPGLDKRGFAKVNIGFRSFDIDINKAKKQEYDESLRSIMDLAGSLIWVGTENGWKKVGRYSDLYWNLYFSSSTAMKSILNVSADKKFVVTFSRDIDKTSINGDTVNLVRALNGEKIPVKFEFLNGRQVKVIPEKLLNNGEAYYLVINKSVKGINGAGMLRDTVAKVRVMANLSRASFTASMTKGVQLGK